MRERESMFAERAAMVRVLAACAHALRSYEHGNGSPDLARTVAAEAEFLLAKNAQADAAQVTDVSASVGTLVPRSFEMPATMTPAIRDALGVMNFQTGPIAHALRDFGATSIRRKAEDEQAVVLHWFLSLAVEHGDGWRNRVGQHLRSLRPAPAPVSEASEGRS